MGIINYQQQNNNYINIPSSDIDDQYLADIPTIGRYWNSCDLLIFNLVADNMAYIVKALPFPFNNEPRFCISINGGTDHVFAWDEKQEQFTSVDANELTAALETAIGEKLQLCAERRKN